MESLKGFFNEIKNEKNVFVMSDICKKYNLSILARSTNNSSFIVKTKQGKFYVTAEKIERV